VSSAHVDCPSGTAPISGGFVFISAEGKAFFSVRNGNGWSVGGDNFDAQFTTGDLTPEVYCAPGLTVQAVGHYDHASDQRLVNAQRAAH
jgi:hypothetical protein